MLLFSSLLDFGKQATAATTSTLPEIPMPLLTFLAIPCGLLLVSGALRLQNRAQRVRVTRLEERLARIAASVGDLRKDSGASPDSQDGGVE